MADGGFRFPGAGQYFYQNQSQQAHHPRHSHQRTGSPVSNSRLAFHSTDTPSPNRSPGTRSPAYSMFNQGHQQTQHGLLNGAQPHQRYQIQMTMGKHYQQQGSQQQGNHHHSQLHPDPSNHNGHSFGTHQHNISSGTLSSATPHFTPSHLQSNTPLGGHGSLNKPTSEHWQEQIRLAQASREANQPHHYARNSPGVNKQVVASLQTGRKEEDLDEKPRLNGAQKEGKQIWQALDFGGQGLKTISSFLFRYPFLEKLYFNHNRLNWLTPQIGQLRSLTFLDLSQNNLESLPAEIGMLVNLKTLFLFDNNLESLPCEMGSLYQLETLGIEGNPLSEDLKGIVADAGTGELVRYLREQQQVPEPPNERDWIVLDETHLASPDQDRFSILSYNILCDKYATPQQYPYVPSAALSWEHRRELIMGEFRARNADFMCLQECDGWSFHEYFRGTLAIDDYKGLFFQKSRAQTMSEKDAKLVDGCAIFYKNSKYILLDKQVVEFGRSAINRPDMKGEHDMFNRVMTRDDIAVIAFFENRATGSRLIVVTTHLFWDPTFADVKNVQVAILMEHLSRLADGYAKWPACKEKELFKYANGEDADVDVVPIVPAPSQSYSHGTDIPVIFSGDFNSMPRSGVCEFITQGTLSNAHTEMTGRHYGNFTRDGMHHPFSLKSSYASIGELDFTNYTSSFNGVLDYIYYSTNALQVTGLLGEPDKDYLQRVPGFPNWHFPSDHLCLFAEFVVKGKKEKKVVEADFGPQRERRHG